MDNFFANDLFMLLLNDQTVSDWRSIKSHRTVIYVTFWQQKVTKSHWTKQRIFSYF